MSAVGADNHLVQSVCTNCLSLLGFCCLACYRDNLEEPAWYPFCQLYDVTIAQVKSNINLLNQKRKI